MSTDHATIVVHRRIALGAFCALLGLPGANLIILVRGDGARDGQALVLSVALIVIAGIGIVLTSDELAIDPGKLTLRRWWGLVRRDYHLEDVSVLLVRAPQAKGTPMWKHLVIGFKRPVVRVVFKDGRRLMFSSVASRTSELLEFAERSGLPILLE